MKIIDYEHIGIRVSDRAEALGDFRERVSHFRQSAGLRAKENDVANA